LRARQKKNILRARRGKIYPTFVVPTKYILTYSSRFRRIRTFRHKKRRQRHHSLPPMKLPTTVDNLFMNYFDDYVNTFYMPKKYF
jgi:hypothetical protein